MAHIEKFIIENFKGATSVTIDLSDRNRCPVITLVGLNESGKTTILEAISFFMTEDANASTLFQGVYSKSSFSNIIPLHLKAAFTGDVRVTANVGLDDVDFEKIEKIFGEAGLEVERSSYSSTMRVVTQYSFVDSAFTQRQFLYSFFPKTKKKSQRRYKLYERPKKADGEVDLSADLWIRGVHHVRDSLPQVVYFPTFLVNMPKTIYLKEHPNETTINKCYRAVIDEVLGYSAPLLSIDQHILKRIDEFRIRTSGENWLYSFNSSGEKNLIDSVMQRLSNLLREQVIEGWGKVFTKNTTTKNIIVDWAIDTQRGGIPYISFFVSDGAERYDLSERSLGFRWFFSFLLFTAFRKSKDKPTLFLFDEPAANLHAKAQDALLKQFETIVQNGAQIIYSTHSHHLINPRWLTGAYIVENKSIDFDAENPFALNSSPTSVSATPYRHFAAQYPNRTSYFQPINESMGYVTPAVIGNSPFVLLEGITDYHAFKAFSLVLDLELGFSLIPGSGAAAAGPLISYLLGRGEKFVLLLDDDEAGHAAAERYIEDWFLPRDIVNTIGRLAEKFKGRRLERLIEADLLDYIKSHFVLDSPPNKKQVGMFLAEACALPSKFDLLSCTKSAANFKEVLLGLKAIVGASTTD